MQTHYPIAIIGGGMAGASLAIALAQQGIQCAVFEAFEPSSQQQPSFDDRTVALSAASLNIFHALGLGQQVLAVSQPIDNIHVSDQGNIGFARLQAQECGVERLGAVIENWQMGNVLNQAMSEHQTIDYFAPAKVKSLQQDKDSAQLTLEYQGQERQVEAQLVVLADGARSPLRSQLHIDSQITDYGKSAIVCNIATQQAHNNWAFERFTKDGPLALLPISSRQQTGSRLAIVWSKPNDKIDEYLSMSESDFARELEHTFGARLGKITKVGERKAFPLIQQVAEPIFRGRAVLIGNAAQSLHPIAGQGFNLALRDVAVLTEVLTQAEDYGNYEILRRYQQQRQPDREQTLMVTETLARLFANQWAPLSISRNLILKAMDITPAAKQLFAQGAMGFNFDNSRLAAGTKK
ncbi:MAG: 2-octaprenyl-6-methoxyphenyl hydroxylase [Kangiellaceae bacterium]|nr:2-octaprenyl-6-methoxyphenyl hydroxylase [Kangiellaceae bacterium]